jgi:transposase
MVRHSNSKLGQLSKLELINLIQLKQKVIANTSRKMELNLEELRTKDQVIHEKDQIILEKEEENRKLLEANQALTETIAELKKQGLKVSRKRFKRSSEKSSAAKALEHANSESKPDEQIEVKKKTRTPRKLKPSERYPDLEVTEEHVEMLEVPKCGVCEHAMADSGMTEDCEYLVSSIRKFSIVLQKRHKYRCKDCFGEIVTTASPQRIKPGSAYGDELILDVALSKYCDLIPIERFAQMASRSGVPGLPPQSLIETTHYLADFLAPAYNRLLQEICTEQVLSADETPHKMLEGSPTKNWYLWCFTSKKSVYFEAHNTRAGEIASKVLLKSDCILLGSDVFSGYSKGVRLANEIRQQKGYPLIQHVYCNAHARRKFYDAKDDYPDEAEYFLNHYKTLYKIEAEARGQGAAQVLEARQQMIPYFEQMQEFAQKNKELHSRHSDIYKAFSYFLKNYEGLTRFIGHPDAEIDNNRAERAIRNPVVGRKTWYGTHSKLGAKTAVVHQSLIESCKLNDVNPRVYYASVVEAIHEGADPLTPYEFGQLQAQL